MIIIHVEFDSFDKDYHLITWFKGSQITRGGGTPSDHSGGHLSPGGECFSPLGSKGLKLHKVEEPPLTTLAATCHREESASHHVFYFLMVPSSSGNDVDTILKYIKNDYK